MAVIFRNVARLTFPLSSSFQQYLWEWRIRFLFVSWLYTQILKCFSLSNKLQNTNRSIRFFIVIFFVNHLHGPLTMVLNCDSAKCNPLEANKSQLCEMALALTSQHLTFGNLSPGTEKSQRLVWDGKDFWRSSGHTNTLSRSCYMLDLTYSI